jgi:hypothetical protein
VLIIDKFTNTAATVAAHHRLRAVGIENAHTEIGNVRAPDEYQAVTADTGVKTAPLYRFYFGVSQLGARRVNIDVVVARAMHFGKFQFFCHDKLIWIFLAIAKLQNGAIF